MDINFWVHCSPTELLDGRGFPVRRNRKSAKATIWPDKEALLKYVNRTFEGYEDLGDRIKVTGYDGPLYFIHIRIEVP